MKTCLYHWLRRAGGWIEDAAGLEAITAALEMDWYGATMKTRHIAKTFQPPLIISAKDAATSGLTEENCP